MIVLTIPKGASRYEYSVDREESLTLVLAMTCSSSTDVRIHLKGRGANAHIIGLAVGKDTTSMKLHTDQLHEAPETTSNLLVKGVLADQATFLYDGAIRVEKDAQKTDAYQRNENLLLSPDAFAESKPTLEILANNVRCTHGATISSLPKDQLWYLASRGIGKKEASSLIVRGFLESALTHVPQEYKHNIVDKVLDVV